MYIRTRRGGTWRKCEYGKDKYRNKSWRGINVVREIEGDNKDVPKEKSSSAYSKHKYEHEERADEYTKMIIYI